MNPVRMMVKRKKGISFILSAIAPETIDIAVATKTTWKKKSEASA